MSVAEDSKVMKEFKNVLDTIAGGEHGPVPGPAGEFELLYSVDVDELPKSFTMNFKNTKMTLVNLFRQTIKQKNLGHLVQIKIHGRKLVLCFKTK